MSTPGSFWVVLGPSGSSWPPWLLLAPPGPTWLRRSRVQLGGLGGARRGQVEPGGTRSSTRSNGWPGCARRHGQGEPGGARRRRRRRRMPRDAKGCQGMPREGRGANENAMWRPWQQEYYISCRTERQPRCSLRLIVLRGSTQACPHKRVREIAEPDHL